MEHLTWLYITGGLLGAAIVYNYYARPRRCSVRAARMEQMLPKYKDL
jgi:hypothetical protein